MDNMSKKTKKVRAKRKSAEEMLAETNAKAQALEAKIALKKVLNNPAVIQLQTKLDELTKTAIEYQKGFGNGPQSFDTRRLTHQLWVDEIRAQQAFAKVALDGINDQRDYLRNQINDLARSITTGLSGPKLDELVLVMLDDIPELDGNAVADTQATLNEAIAARQAHTLEKKMPKKARKAL